MSTLAPSRPELHAAAPAPLARRSERWHIPVLLLFWAAIFLTSLATPPLLDDADATHAEAAQAMLHTGDWVTLHVNGIRYLEKAPLPYWIAAVSLRIFGENAFAIHLPLALAVLGLAALGYRWALRVFDRRTAFYTALFFLTSIGPFLFTRIFIPDALLSLLLACALYAFHLSLDPQTHAGAPLIARPHRAMSGLAKSVSSKQTLVPALLFWLSMALAVLTKGLIAIIFLLATATLYLTLTRSWRHWRALYPLAGTLLFLAVAAPWHLLAGLRNTGAADGHGFFWFYFVNEHVLRFLGRRIPRDYNKLPALWYWLLHLVWLFPWSFLFPVTFLTGWRVWRQRRNAYYHAIKMGRVPERRPNRLGRFYVTRWLWLRFTGAVAYATPGPTARSVLLLGLFSAVILVFFAFSTNQEYYTFPVYLPVLMLVAAALSQRNDFSRKATERGLITLSAVAMIAALLLAEELIYSRHLASSSELGALLAHRSIGNYTLSLSHFFDLTGASLAALRLPALLALVSLATGPNLAWLLLRRRSSLFAPIFCVALSSATFLIAAHIALTRFAPLLSSRDFADCVLSLQSRHQIEPNTQIAIFGDQAFGSSIPFYLGRPVQLVDGRSSSMLFGSTFPDVPNSTFLSATDLVASWGRGPRKLLFVPTDQRDTADRLLGFRALVLFQSSGKELLTDRPLASPPSSFSALSTGTFPPSAISTGARGSGEPPVFAPASARLGSTIPQR